MKTRHLGFVAAVVSLIVIPIGLAARLRVEKPMPALRGANGWVNSPPLTTSDLRGKVVLVDFWTYTCINWRRTMPYLRAWAEKYKDNGLVVVGVHTPEFSFEKDLDNVRRAAKEQRVDYPIAVDNVARARLDRRGGRVAGISDCPVRADAHGGRALRAIRRR
jgi:thiol-disulfide isomerase/thioredoxin